MEREAKEVIDHERGTQLLADCKAFVEEKLGEEITWSQFWDLVAEAGNWDRKLEELYKLTGESHDQGT